MTAVSQDPSRGDEICPRCGATVEVTAAAGLLRGHKDPLVGSSCPMGGYTPEEAAEVVGDERVRLGLPVVGDVA